MTQVHNFLLNLLHLANEIILHRIFRTLAEMSKAGYPYDNAPMERYYNTLKNELIYLHYYHDDNALNSAIEEFAYVTYNHVRPHSYNGYKTPFEARYAAAK